MKNVQFALTAALMLVTLTACGSGSNNSASALLLVNNWPSSAQSVSAAYFQSVAFRNGTTAVAWGNNDYGQLGNSNSGKSLTPVRIFGLSQMSGVVTGGTHSLAFVNGSSVRAWGNNGHGQLGNGTVTATYKPVGVRKVFNNVTSTLSRVSAVAGGGYHSLALADGAVWAWGANSWGQLGYATPTSIYSVYARRVAFPPLGGFPVTGIAAGGGHSLALVSGEIWAWGNNYAGQVGDNSTVNKDIPVQVVDPAGTGILNNAKAIAAGGSHSLALLNDTTVVGWGYNYYGQLGDSSFVSSAKPVRVVVDAGNTPLSGVIAISAGLDHSLALTSDGSVWAWGYNGYGQLGKGTTVDSPLAVKVAILDAANNPVVIDKIVAIGFHSLAFSGSRVWAWGYNAFGQIGNNSTTTVLTPQQLAAFP